MAENISIRGARVNNLKNISLEIPRGKLVVVTGISGSGKSSLAFDALFAEGQRRFAESLSSYARQFLGRMSKPDVDSIEGIPPAIAIEQKVTVRNPRSTVATTTEIYDFVRLVFARIGKTYSPVSGNLVHADGLPDVLAYADSCAKAEFPLMVLADLRWSWRQDRTELLLQLKEDGYNRLWVGGKPMRIDDALKAGADSVEDARLLVDRFSNLDDRQRVSSSITDAFARGEGDIDVVSSVRSRHFCNRFELDGITFRVPDEFLFSFNSPLGACPVCGGLGKIIGVSEDLVVPDKTLSIYDGAIACWRGEKMCWFKDHLIEQAERCGIPVFEPYCNLSEEVRRLIWDGEKASGDIDEEQRVVGVR